MSDPVLSALIASAAPSAAVIISYVLSRHDRRTKTEATDSKLAEIHVLVNSRLSEALEEIAALKARLDR